MFIQFSDQFLQGLIHRLDKNIIRGLVQDHDDLFHLPKVLFQLHRHDRELFGHLTLGFPDQGKDIEGLSFGKTEYFIAGHCLVGRYQQLLDLTNNLGADFPGRNLFDAKGAQKLI